MTVRGVTSGVKPLALIAAVASALAALGATAAPAQAPPPDGRIVARPHPFAPPRFAPRGFRVLPGGGELYVPRTYARWRPVGFVLALHGATQDAAVGMALFQPLADRARLIVLAPKSVNRTWDGVTGDFGPDVAAINRHLRAIFARYAIAPRRVYIAGFSDGATYALSLGLTNGDLFRRVVAFSPGSASPAALRGRPPIFVSHGTNDPVLPIDDTSRLLVPELRRRGYDVTYREFDGAHTVPPAIARAAVIWLGRPG